MTQNPKESDSGISEPEADQRPDSCWSGDWPELFAVLQTELRELARAAMRGERPGHTLQTTALIHEAYLRLAHSSEIEIPDRLRFLALASKVMRRVLIDHARRNRALRRGGDQRRVHITLDGRSGSDGLPPLEVLDLDDALRALALTTPRKAQVVELRFFGGLSVEEVAEILSIDRRTVVADWNFARAWLLRRLSESARPTSPKEKEGPPDEEL